MNKKQFQSILLIFGMATFQQAFAHGGGSSSGSYDFEKSDYAAEREANKKVVEKKQEQDDWADFMKKVNASDKKEKTGSAHDHHEGAVTE